MDFNLSDKARLHDPQSGYSTGYPPAGAYPNQPAGAAPSGYPQGGPPPPQGNYQQGGYPGGPPPPQGYQQQGQGAPGGYPNPPQQGYPGGQPAPPQGYPGGPPAPQQGYPGGPPAGAVPAGAAPPQGNAPPQYKGEMPADDVEDNPNAVAPAASAPPIDKMDEITGYSNFTGGMLPPPSYDEATREPPAERQAIGNVPTITEQDAREALLSYVAEHCCYGKGAAEDLKYLDLKSTSAFHYTLETYTEGRSTSWGYDPFSGQPIDGPQNGPAPGPWDILAQCPNLFQNHTQHVEVPHTASVKPCHECLASGFVRCPRCHGRGRVRCSTCHGSGHKTVYRDGEHRRESCSWCHGSGRRTCHGCHGCGMITCPTCTGFRQLKCYIKLTITWTNRVVDHIVERTPLPDHLIRGVSGQLAFEETQPRVWPIQHFPDSEINDASRRLVQQQQFPTERILQQRHNVRIVPVTQCMYQWKDKNSDYFVYGFEHKVHAPDYPQTCCCGCSIL